VTFPVLASLPMTRTRVPLGNDGSSKSVVSNFHSVPSSKLTLRIASSAGVRISACLTIPKRLLSANPHPRTWDSLGIVHFFNLLSGNCWNQFVELR
jgi:hypothetical protein